MGKAPVARLGMRPPAAAARARLGNEARAAAAAGAFLAPRAAPSFGPAPRRPARRVAS